MPDDEARRAARSAGRARDARASIATGYAYGVGDVVIWDNASLLHSATLTDPDDPRTLWRITVKEPRLAAQAVLAPTYASRST